MLSVMLHKYYQAVFYKASQYFPTKTCDQTQWHAQPFGSDVNVACTLLIATSSVEEGILIFSQGYLHLSGRIKTDHLETPILRPDMGRFYRMILLQPKGLGTLSRATNEPCPNVVPRAFLKSAIQQSQDKYTSSPKLHPERNSKKQPPFFNNPIHCSIKLDQSQ